MRTKPSIATIGQSAARHELLDLRVTLNGYRTMRAKDAIGLMNELLACYCHAAFGPIQCRPPVDFCGHERGTVYLAIANDLAADRGMAIPDDLESRWRAGRPLVDPS